jgi:hypothetical protein
MMPPGSGHSATAGSSSGSARRRTSTPPSGTFNEGEQITKRTGIVWSRAAGEGDGGEVRLETASNGTVPVGTLGQGDVRSFSWTARGRKAGSVVLRATGRSAHLLACCRATDHHA